MEYGLNVSDMASAALQDVADRAADPTQFYEAAARLVVGSLVPEEFSDGGAPGEPRWAGGMRGGQPLMDTGKHLLASIQKRSADSGGLVISSRAKGANLLQFGGTVVPINGPFLVFPNPNPGANTQTGRRMGGDGVELIFARKVTIPGRPYLAWFASWITDVVELGREYLRTGKAD